MERQSGSRNPEIARDRSEESPQRQTSERVQRALGRAATANNVQNPSALRSTRVQKALGVTATEVTSSASRTRSRGRG